LAATAGVLYAAWLLIATIKGTADPASPGNSAGAEATSRADATKHAAPAADDKPLAPFHFADILGGHWQFAGSAWQIGLRELPGADALEALQTAPQQPQYTPSADRADTDAQALALFDALGAKSISSGHVNRRLVRMGDFAAAAYSTRDAAGEYLIAIRVATGLDGQAQMVELTPSPTTPVGSGDKPLIGLPEKVDVLARRLDRNGLPCGLVATTSKQPNDLVAFWRNEGWQLHSVPGENSLHQWLCSRSGVTIFVILRELEVGANFLFLVRLPEDQA
jgi:hypothetical protein